MAGRLSDLMESAPTISVADIRAWIEDRPSRVEVLDRILSSARGKSGDLTQPPLMTPGGVEESTLLGVLKDGERDGAELLDALISYVRNGLGTEDQERLLRAVVASTEASRFAGQVLAEGSEVRLQRLEKAARTAHSILFERDRSYRGLPNAEPAAESQLKQCILDDPWLVSVDHAALYNRQDGPDGEINYFVRRYDGAIDFVQIRGATDELVGQGELTVNRSISREYWIGMKLNAALAQALRYQLQFREGGRPVTTASTPRAYIVIGKICTLNKTARSIFDRHRHAYPGIETICFDEIPTRAFRGVYGLQEMVNKARLIEMHIGPETH